MPFLVELLIALLIVSGGVFTLLGSYGLVKLPDLMSRLHAPTKATTLGVGSLLLASMLYFLAADGGFSIHELIITLFLFLTAPITANFVAKALMHAHLRPEDLPKTGGPAGWATYEAPAGQHEATTKQA